MDSTQARQAAQVLKEHAPTKSHEVRRACMEAARALEAVANAEDDIQTTVERYTGSPQARCTCPVGFGQVAAPDCPVHGVRQPAHTITAPPGFLGA